ncbi:MAG: glutathione peroxidase [Pseudohongiellaceae bacterium]
MKALKTLCAALVVLAAANLIDVPVSTTASAQDAACAPWLEHEMTMLHSADTIDLCAETAGKPVLLVNTASYCGFTYQFTGLESLYQRFKNDGLVIVGFPSDDFNQEDDDAAKTAEVCYINHGVTFLMTDVTHVKGAEAHPVFAHLGAQSGEPQWNFNKYLVSKSGEVLAHFDSRVEPDAEELIRAIEEQI